MVNGLLFAPRPGVNIVSKKAVKLFLSIKIKCQELSKHMTDISFSSYFTSEIFPVPGTSGLNQGKLLL